jgi:hypothetical protein
MGEALRRLAIPVGEVLSSPLLRAMQTAEALSLARIEPITELAEGEANSAWLSTKAAQAPLAGTNLLIITHSTNTVFAFGGAGRLLEGESLIIQPEGGKAVVVARVKIEGWPAFATE